MDENKDIILETTNISKMLYSPVNTTLIDNVSIKIYKGEFAAITGISGSGKSSLLYVLGLLDNPTKGKLFINKEQMNSLSDISKSEFRLKNIGFIFQFHFLINELTILENVLLPMKQRGVIPEKEQVSKVMELLKYFAMQEHYKKYPHQLSGGQRQRVAIARALANDPLILLADEPTGSLDSKNTNLVLSYFNKLKKEKNMTIILVTHESDIHKITDKVITLEDGKVVGSN